jgi:3,4-dihydroxy 2-butanone 4-phosphate synthase/GTP cyclohydrolase II
MADEMRRSTVEETVAAFRRGEVVLVVDDEDRENEGDLLMAAEHATPEKIAFFLEHTSGLICVPVPPERLDELAIPMMVEQNTEAQRTAFAVTVDVKRGTTTGISAHDRCATVLALADPATKPADLARPGHIHVLRARDGGVLKRAGHTEAGVDLARLAGLQPVAVLCEVVTKDKLDMARRDELVEFAEVHDMPIITVADLIEYRRRTEQLVVRGAEVRLPTKHGEFRCTAYTSKLDGETHLAIVAGEPAGKADVLVRVHSECLTGDVFGSRRCDCGEQLEESMRKIAEAGEGVIVYLRGHEGRGIGISHKLEAYQLQESGMDTVDANTALGLPVDSREYGIGAQILADMGITTMRLMTNNPAKRAGLQGFGLVVTERVPLESHPNADNIAYLQAKRERMGHILGGLDGVEADGGS